MRISRAAATNTRRENRRIGNLYFRHGKRLSRQARQAMYGSRRAKALLQAARHRSPAPPPLPRRRQCYQPHGAASSNDGEVSDAR
jgi:hypothetical protein